MKKEGRIEMERSQVCPHKFVAYSLALKETASVRSANFQFYFCSYIVHLHFAYFVAINLLSKDQVSGRKDMGFGKGREQIKYQNTSCICRKDCTLLWAVIVSHFTM